MPVERRVLDVGNCGPDHRSICSALSSRFAVDVVQAHGPTDTLELLKSSTFDLVLINRKLDQDYSDGIEILRLIKSDPDTRDVPVMLITNFEEHQQQAVEAGAVLGFGKLELSKESTFERLSAIIG